MKRLIQCRNREGIKVVIKMLAGLCDDDADKGKTITQSVVQFWHYRQQDGWANRLAHLTVLI